VERTDDREALTPDEAVERIRQLRAEQHAEGARVTHEELIAWKNEGRDKILERYLNRWDREDAELAARDET
jgi:hypothetical protein